MYNKIEIYDSRKKINHLKWHICKGRLFDKTKNPLVIKIEIFTEDLSIKKFRCLEHTRECIRRSLSYYKKHNFLDAEDLDIRIPKYLNVLDLKQDVNGYAFIIKLEYINET